jgi:tripartite-type tricarboxylate transporter receptor subunit TctC
VGVTSSGRSTLAPELASLADAGIPGINLEVWNALIGPASLPAPVVHKLSQTVVTLLREPQTRQRLFTQGWQAVGTAPEGLVLRAQTETAALAAIIKARGIQTD